MPRLGIILIARNRHWKGQWLKRDRRIFVSHITSRIRGPPLVCNLVPPLSICPFTCVLINFARDLSALSVFSKNQFLVLLMLVMPIFYIISLCPHLYFFPSTLFGLTFILFLSSLASWAGHRILYRLWPLHLFLREQQMKTHFSLYHSCNHIKKFRNVVILIIVRF